MAYKVKLDVFEGPFDLLVYLIENAEMNIYDIPVAEITRQYIQYIEDMKRADVAVAGEEGVGLFVGCGPPTGVFVKSVEVAAHDVEGDNAH